MSALSDPILILLIGSISGLIALCCRLGYSSKCTKIKCGCIEILRDTQHEQAISITPTVSNPNASFRNSAP